MREDALGVGLQGDVSPEVDPRLADVSPEVSRLPEACPRLAVWPRAAWLQAAWFPVAWLRDLPVVQGHRLQVEQEADWGLVVRGRVLGNCEAPGLNQSGIAGRCPGRAPIPLWSLSRSMPGRAPALGVEGRVPAPAPGRLGVDGRVDGCPAEGRLGVEGRVDGCPAEGRFDGCPAEGRLGADGAGRVDGRVLGAEGRLAEGVLGRLIDGERLAEEPPPPPARPPPPPPPRPPRWARAASATRDKLKTKTVRIRAYLLIGISPSHFSARPSVPSGGRR